MELEFGHKSTTGAITANDSLKAIFYDNSTEMAAISYSIFARRSLNVPGFNWFKGAFTIIIQNEHKMNEYIHIPLYLQLRIDV